MNFKKYEYFNEVTALEDTVKLGERIGKTAEEAAKTAKLLEKLGKDIGETSKALRNTTKASEKAALTAKLETKAAALKTLTKELNAKNLEKAAAQKKALKSISTGVDDLSKTSNKALKKDIKGIIENNSKKGIKGIIERNPDKVLGAIVAAAVGTAYLASVIKKYKENNNKKLTITNSYKSNTGPNDIIIEFTPDTDIVSGDSITMGSDTTFVGSLANVNVDVNTINSKTSITITSPYSITEYSKGGTMTLHTSIANQSIAIAKETGSTTGQIVGGATGGALSGFVSGSFNGLFGSMGQYVLYGVIALITIFAIVFIMKMLKKHNE